MSGSETLTINGTTAREKPLSPFVYDRIFMYSSMQFCGHIEEFFAGRTSELLVYIVQPRIGKHKNLLRRYHAGVLAEEYAVCSSQNLFLYYLLWYMNHVIELLRFCPKGAKTLVLGWHPIAFFGMRILKWFRPISFAYWIGDYFPSRHPIILAYERVKRSYQSCVDYVFYLSDAINRKMNGVVVKTPYKRTVMWGLKPFSPASGSSIEPFSLLFVGLIRPGQGLETLLEFLAVQPEYHLSIIGVGQAVYVRELQARLLDPRLSGRVFFPNRFYSEKELLEVARYCHLGIALYDTDAENFTHYADPGKVKAYAEMHLPVLMSRVSDIVQYVEGFGSGEIVDRIDQIGDALERIRTNYSCYQSGLDRFIEHFAFDRYYSEAFDVFKECWK